MALSDQIRKHRLAKGLSIAELARRAKLSKGYLGQLEKGLNGVNPSGEVLYRLAFALGTSVSELLEKQIENSNIDITEIPEELRKFALDEQLSDEDIKMLARIEFRGRRPRTVKDWNFLYESIKRSVSLEDETFNRS
jgi:transcriptional regulator with XRE-family HTH domain